MSQSYHPSQDQLERRRGRQKRKEHWDRVWIIVLLTLAGLYILWNIITVISHHV
ncbi:MAG: hypothetical protein IMZ62_10595 [Chloroflexi bacterium]|nr:hypothetical protein [Chloroflexota bacterium]